MAIPGSAGPFLLAQLEEEGGYEIERSLRFNSSDSAYLSKNFGSAGNRKTWTWAGWVKRVKPGQSLYLKFVQGGSTYPYEIVYFDNADRLVHIHDNDSFAYQRRTLGVFRDPSAWYHIVFAADTTQATASNRLKIYVNGLQQDTEASASGDMPLNFEGIFNSTTPAYINGQASGNFYLADNHFIDGQALTPSSFGEFDTNGVWQPIDASGLTYGTNGFHLPFSDNSTAAALGTDTSSNGNTWTVNNISVLGALASPNWAANLTSSTGSFAGGYPAADAFDGNTGTGAATSTGGGLSVNLTWTNTSFNSGNPTLRVYTYQAYKITVDGVTKNADGAGPNSIGWVDCGTITGGFSTVVVYGYSGTNSGSYIAAIEVNGQILVGPLVAAGNDSLVDSPTNYGEDTGAGGEVVGNYCTWNPLNKGSNLTISNGNLDVSGSTGHATVLTTIPVVAGMKSYMEFTVTTDGAGGWGVTTNPAAENSYGEIAGKWWVYDNGGTFVIINQTSGTGYSPRVNSGDVLQLAIDYSTGKVHVGINNTWINSTNGTDGNPATGANPTFTLSTTAPIFPIFESASLLAAANFGQRAFAYTAPSGFKALCTTNLPEPTIADGSTAMDVALYTGNGSTQNITGLAFSPDFVWIKRRSSSTSHALLDVIRGTNKVLYSNLTAAEDTYTDTLTAFNSDGFSLGADASWGGVNTSSSPYVAWTWDAGSSTVTNTQGSITSQVRANASAGFSVVTYTGSGSAATVGHGLGVAPSWVIIKNRTTAYDWIVYANESGTLKQLYLNLTLASAGAGLSLPSSTTFNLPGGGATGSNGSGDNYVAYCFAPVAGYSSFGSYTGNGSTDGPFVYTGFRPRWVMVKRTDAAYGWYMYDTARDTYNIAGEVLLANASDAEVSDSDLDILSNGFKPRRSSNAFNASGGTFIYIAFAESPFAYARAR